MGILIFLQRETKAWYIFIVLRWNGGTAGYSSQPQGRHQLRRRRHKSQANNNSLSPPRAPSNSSEPYACTVIIIPCRSEAIIFQKAARSFLREEEAGRGWPRWRWHPLLIQLFARLRRFSFLLPACLPKERKDVSLSAAGAARGRAQPFGRGCTCTMTLPPPLILKMGCRQKNWLASRACPAADHYYILYTCIESKLPFKSCSVWTPCSAAALFWRGRRLWKQSLTGWRRASQCNE